MSDTTQTNAMAEIALALAMGFFSIMVLTMVSMGSGMVSQAAQSSIKEDPINIAKTAEQSKRAPKEGEASAVAPENLVIFYHGHYLDNQLQPVDPSDLMGRDKVVLAVSPDLSMSKTMQARKTLAVQDITVVVLNEKWLMALKEAAL
ncbi:MAG: hypothetical protein HWE30_12670 [Methylocystaceae bacterium]|nr:hypothetical protein [Methylocystaceae bacterium]